MNFTCLKKDLEKALLVAQRVVSKNQSLPIIENVLFKVKKNELFISATNLELFVEIKLTASVEGEASFAIPPEIVLKILKSDSEDKNVNFSYDGSSVKIMSKNGNSVLKVLNPEDFPLMQKSEEFGENPLTIDKAVLFGGIKHSYMYASQSPVKPEISSIYIYEDSGFLTFVSTDLFRLAEKKIKIENLKNFPPVLVPVKNAIGIMRILETVEEPEKIKISVNENQLYISSSSLFLSSRVIDATFPDYKSIIPENFVSKSVLLKGDFEDALRKTSLFTDKFNKVTLKQDPKSSKLFMYSKNNDIGESEEAVEAKIEGEEISLSFNCRYLLEVLPNITSDSLELNFAGPEAPLIIKAVGDKSFIYLLMPMNK